MRRTAPVSTVSGGVPSSGSASRSFRRSSKISRCQSGTGIVSGVAAIRSHNDSAVEEALRLLIKTRSQKSIRRLRGKVPWEGDLDTSRLGRVAK